MDKYDSFAELKRQETQGKDFGILIRKGHFSLAVMAPHGGGIEPGTAEIAEAVAGREFSLYCFKGTKPSGNFDLHITSAKFDEPQALKIAEKVQHVLAIHGCRGDTEVVLLGGMQRILTAYLQRAIREAGFKVLQPKGPRLAGCNPANICNRGRSSAGAQLEISAALRKKLLAPAEGSGKKRSALFYQFAAAVRRALLRAAFREG